ncbi:MAG: ATP-binding cassette domain-containing protein [Bacteroides sp.]|nr:ATP-binding cassette domain-containing protein [Bacteroides sp.]MDD2645518.1 ATP-binding cassette domain-containing protein [Bacteroides sp.]MDD4054678.1 ATP-binding cassette domain-containing protein [Bacteroides sp.]MDD4720124.1 ATP-binding cassette domain-containing protein [Bacteroides sp.]NLI64310.1 ATP-binding cassette domain-containing protein [Bacteroidales bacterium]
MEYIELQNTLPEAFKQQNIMQSDIWHQVFRFQKNKIYLIKAVSGAGKSSLCSYLYGERKDYQGIITFDNSNISSLNAKDWTTIRRNNISQIFQDLRLFPELTALENIQIKNNLTRRRKRKEIVNWFERLGLAEHIKRPVGKLSFGQQQRVAFIRSLCQPFDFILLDEPVSHLDKNNANEMSNILLEEFEKNSFGVIVTSIGRDLELPYDYIMNL